MLARTTLLTALLLATLVPLAPSASAWVCVPAQDLSARTITTPLATYYERAYSIGAGTVVELWREANGEPGLQTHRQMSCVGKADGFVQARCIGLCPITM